MKDFIVNILKGTVVGLANVIPGVSGGTMMVSMGIYDRLILVLTHFVKRFKEAVMLVLPLGIGMVLSIVLFSKIFSEFLFPKFPLQTNLFFIGLIIGGLPAIYKEVKGKKVTAPSLIAFAAFFVLVVAFAMMGEGTEQGADVSLSLVNIVKLFVAGIIAAATMVIPGVSGSMVMMIIGYYTTIIGSINGMVNSLVSGDIQGMLACATVLIPFALGAVFGVIAIAKLLEYVFKKFRTIAYWAIMGLIVASPFAILLIMEITAIGVMEILTGIVMLAVGFFIAMKLGAEGK